MKLNLFTMTERGVSLVQPALYMAHNVKYDTPALKCTDV